MKERPISFTGDSVRAIRAGTKTQTRRVLKPQPIDTIPVKGDQAGRAWVALMHVDIDPAKNSGRAIRCRYGYPGERLWVRETWRVEARGARLLLDLRADIGAPEMRDVTGVEAARKYARKLDAWRPCIFMPRWASRIDLEVVVIRLERLQEISREDCIAEGCPRDLWYRVPGGHRSLRQTIADLVNQLRALKAQNDTLLARVGEPRRDPAREADFDARGNR